MSNSSAFVRLGLSLWTAVASFASRADPASFKISQIYSNLDGSTRFIRLTESQGPTGHDEPFDHRRIDRLGDFAGVDEIRYAALPTDGTNGLDHELFVGRAIVS